MPKTGRFYVSQSDSGDQYIIPWEKREEWENYVKASDEGWAEAVYDDVPEFAVRVDGGVLTFCSWKII